MPPVFISPFVLFPFQPFDLNRTVVMMCLMIEFGPPDSLDGPDSICLSQIPWSIKTNRFDPPRAQIYEPTRFMFKPSLFLLFLLIIPLFLFITPFSLKKLFSLCFFCLKKYFCLILIYLLHCFYIIFHLFILFFLSSHTYLIVIMFLFLF